MRDYFSQQIDVEMDLTGVGCDQVKYICAQLYRNDAGGNINNDDFTYGFTDPRVSSVGVTGQFPDSILDTDPGSSQWASVEIGCKGKEKKFECS